MPAEGVDDLLDQAVVFVSVDPAEEGAPRTQTAHQRAEPRLGIGQVMENPDRVDEIEVAAGRRPTEGRIVDVSLDDVSIWQVPHVFVCGLDRIAEVDADHLFGSIAGREESMP